MKITPIKQPDDSACGPTSIQMALQYFGILKPFEEIARISKYRRKGGLYNSDLVKTLSIMGFQIKEKTNARWGDVIRNNTNNKVIIVSWMMQGYIGHFSIVDEIRDDFIILADPSNGELVKMEKLIFMRLWMDYDYSWYPKKNTDIQLRWMCVISKK